MNSGIRDASGHTRCGPIDHKMKETPARYSSWVRYEGLDGHWNQQDIESGSQTGEELSRYECYRTYWP